MQCRVCDAENPADEKFCQSCGFPVLDNGQVKPSGEIICPGCKCRNNPGSFFCYSCGIYFAGSTAQPAGGTQKRQAAAQTVAARQVAAKARLVMPGGNIIDLNGAPAFIERSDFNSPLPEDLLMSISRKHVLITYDKGTYYVQDYGRDGQGTTNHTNLNGTDIYRLSRQVLKDGDKIQIARQPDLTLTFRQPKGVLRNKVGRRHG